MTSRDIPPATDLTVSASQTVGSVVININNNDNNQNPCQPGLGVCGASLSSPVCLASVRCKRHVQCLDLADDDGAQ